MINFGNAVLGLLLFVLGIVFITRTTKNKDFEDVYGNYISIYTGEVGLILLGLFLFIRESLKIL